MREWVVPMKQIAQVECRKQGRAICTPSTAQAAQPIPERPCSCHLCLRPVLLPVVVLRCDDEARHVCTCHGTSEPVASMTFARGLKSSVQYYESCRRTSTPAQLAQHVPYGGLPAPIDPAWLPQYQLHRSLQTRMNHRTDRTVSLHDTFQSASPLGVTNRTVLYPLRVVGIMLLRDH